MSEFLLKVGCPFNVISWNDLIISDRYMVEICRKLKVQFKVTEFEGTEEEAIKHAWDLNNHRRHYEGKEQKAMVGAKLAKMLEEAAKQRQQAGGLASNEAKGRSAEQAAKSVGVSRSQVNRAKSVLANGTPELVQAVEEGDVTVSDAAAVAKEPPASQRAAVNAVKEGKAKTARAAVGSNGKAHRNGKAPGKKIKAGKPLFDDRKIEDLIGKLIRAIDQRSEHYGTGKPYQDCVAAMESVQKSWKTWQKAGAKA